MNQPSEDLAVTLASEFATWLTTLAVEHGDIFRAFSGVKRDGRQVVLIMSDLPFDGVKRRDFMIWLCRAENFVAYAYGTPVMAVGGDGEMSEEIAIYASSEQYDVSTALEIEPSIAGRYIATERSRLVFPAGAADLFLGLQRYPEEKVKDDSGEFDEAWSRIRTKCMWRQRREPEFTVP